MKKEYETPEAKMVEFDYKEQVIASGVNVKQQDEAMNNRCYTDPCTGETRECRMISTTQCSIP